MSNCNSGLQLINKVESWMIFNSDHWFINPTVWKKINKSDQEEILDSLFSNKQSEYGEFHKTIFNDIKLKAIKLIETKSNEIPDSHLKFILKEKGKITLANTVYN